MVQNVTSSEVINTVIDLFSKGLVFFASNCRCACWYSPNLFNDYEHIVSRQVVEFYARGFLLYATSQQIR